MDRDPACTVKSGQYASYWNDWKMPSHFPGFPVQVGTLYYGTFTPKSEIKVPRRSDRRLLKHRSHHRSKKSFAFAGAQYEWTLALGSGCHVDCTSHACIINNTRCYSSITQQFLLGMNASLLKKCAK